MPFKKGQSGNPDRQFSSENQPETNGRPHKLPELDNLLADILGEVKDGRTAAQAILTALRSKATKGDIRAAEVLLDRAYGKARQEINLGGDVGITWNETKKYDNPDPKKIEGSD